MNNNVSKKEQRDNTRLPLWAGAPHSTTFNPRKVFNQATSSSVRWVSPPAPDSLSYATSAPDTLPNVWHRALVKLAWRRLKTTLPIGCRPRPSQRCRRGRVNQVRSYIHIRVVYSVFYFHVPRFCLFFYTNAVPTLWLLPLPNQTTRPLPDKASQVKYILFV